MWEELRGGACGDKERTGEMGAKRRVMKNDEGETEESIEKLVRAEVAGPAPERTSHGAGRRGRVMKGLAEANGGTRRRRISPQSECRRRVNRGERER